MIPRRRTLLTLAFLLIASSLVVYVTGGFVSSVLGVRISARSPLVGVLAALAALALWAFLAKRARAIDSDLAAADAWVSAHASAIILTIAGTAGAVALRFASFSAAGSDASGYLSQSALLWSGQLMRYEPLTALADWSNAPETLAPLGWRPALETGMQVPTYAVGLPLLIGPFHGLGDAIVACATVAASLFVAVGATGALALRIAGPYAAILAALWLATSPVALIEAMQPMSDVPVTAAWLVCWMLIIPRGPGNVRTVLAGVVAALAVLIRPNLAPLAAIPTLWLLLRGDLGNDRPLRRVVAFSAPVLLAGLLVAYLQWRWFGSPLRSGYGTAPEIYATAHLASNAALYTRWLLETHGPWLLAAPLAWFWPGGRIIRWLLVFATSVVVAYLLYSEFEVWTYLRFLLPALTIAMIAVSSMIAMLVAKLQLPVRAPVLAIVALSLVAAGIVSARSLGVFRFAATQSRAALAGRYLSAALPAKSVVIAGEQSGSVRYYTQRPIVRWDVAAPEALDRAIDGLGSQGHDVWITLDVWEEEPFRRKFPNTLVGALDWPPQVEAGSEVLTRAWRIRDHDRFLRGEHVSTDRLR